MSVIGTLLSGCFKQVDDTIQQALQNARNAGIDLELRAGTEINLAIENAKNAYKDSLNLTVDKLDETGQKTINGLSSLVQKFQSQVLNEMEDLTLQAQQLANTLPFASKNPQLTSVSPRYLVIGDVAQTSLVTFKGNFPCSAKPGFEPSLKIGEQECPIADKTTQSISFQVPNNSLDNQNKDLYTYRPASLTVPWDDGWIWSHKTEYSYQVGLGCLPQQAGVATAFFTDKELVRVFQPKSSSPFQYNGNDWYPQHWHTIDQDVFPDLGWKVDPSKTPALVVQHLHGDHNQQILAVTPDKITFRVNLYCKDGHDIGIVNMRVDFTQWQDQAKETTRCQNYPINWKDSVLVEPQSHETVSYVDFAAYDGSKQVFGAPDNSDKSVLKVEAEPNGMWKLWAEPPKSLKTA